MKIVKIARNLIVFIIISSMMTLTAFADDFDWYKYPCVSPESVLLPRSEKTSVVKYQPLMRGDIIAAAILGIGDEGDGKIGISAQTLCYVPIDKCRMRIYLDRWNEKDQRWAMVSYEDITYVKEDDPNGLTVGNANYTIINEPRGYYYRARGLHAVYLGTDNEMLSTETNGIFLDEK